MYKWVCWWWEWQLWVDIYHPVNSDTALLSLIILTVVTINSRQQCLLTFILINQSLVFLIQSLNHWRWIILVWTINTFTNLNIDTKNTFIHSFISSSGSLTENIWKCWLKNICWNETSWSASAQQPTKMFQQIVQVLCQTNLNCF